ncbi:hypothetical protein MSAN_01682300 [Mycena sanguinolenta]|uniref:Uncharacterized protein n=1 Tax=Mycena sanguinolenta TaxID=230812 RepID=A0A8H7CVJ3_9AGAR|nr:hypothetical protein MSAN_01682300 [Mycena sanguinolenta]
MGRPSTLRVTLPPISHVPVLLALAFGDSASDGRRRVHRLPQRRRAGVRHACSDRLQGLSNPPGTPPGATTPPRGTDPDALSLHSPPPRERRDILAVAFRYFRRREREGGAAGAGKGIDRSGSDTVHMTASLLTRTHSPQFRGPLGTTPRATMLLPSRCTHAGSISARGRARTKNGAAALGEAPNTRECRMSHIASTTTPTAHTPFQHLRHTSSLYPHLSDPTHLHGHGQTQAAKETKMAQTTTASRTTAHGIPAPFFPLPPTLCSALLPRSTPTSAHALRHLQAVEDEAAGPDGLAYARPVGGSHRRSSSSGEHCRVRDRGKDVWAGTRVVRCIRLFLPSLPSPFSSPYAAALLPPLPYSPCSMSTRVNIRFADTAREAQEDQDIQNGPRNRTRRHLVHSRLGGLATAHLYLLRRRRPLLALLPAPLIGGCGIGISAIDPDVDDSFAPFTHASSDTPGAFGFGSVPSSPCTSGLTFVPPLHFDPKALLSPGLSLSRCAGVECGVSDVFQHRELHKGFSAAPPALAVLRNARQPSRSLTGNDEVDGRRMWGGVPRRM